MPNCQKVDSSGNPVLSSMDNFSHLAFEYFSCPSTHPYRIPMISNNYDFPISMNSNWKLSSDIIDAQNPQPKGSTAHGDAFINWSDEGREAIFNCARKGQNCELWSTGDEDKNTEGKLVYKDMKYIGDFTALGALPALKTVHLEQNSSSSTSLSSAQTTSTITSSGQSISQNSSSSSQTKMLSSSSKVVSSSSTNPSSSKTSESSKSISSQPKSSNDKEVKQKLIEELKRKIDAKITKRNLLNQEIQNDKEKLKVLRNE